MAGIEKFESVLPMLTDEANAFLEKEFDLTLDIPILLNGRLRQTLGRFLVDDEGNAPMQIEISKNLLRYYDETELLEVLKHELVHYALFVLGKPCEDGNPYFESELARLGISSAEMLRYRGVIHVYQCGECGVVMFSENKLTIEKYESTCCDVEFQHVASRLIKSEEDWEVLDIDFNSGSESKTSTENIGS